MRPTQKARMFSEAVGNAVAFGASITCCDVFNSPSIRGFVHHVRVDNTLVVRLIDAFSKDVFGAWLERMEEAEGMALERKHDSCDYGVLVVRHKDTVSLSVARHYYSVSSAVEGAEQEMTVSSIYDLSEIMTPIKLEAHGRVPGTDGFWQQRENREYEYIPYDDEYNRGIE